jgi:hypothetical protein
MFLLGFDYNMHSWLSPKCIYSTGLTGELGRSFAYYIYLTAPYIWVWTVVVSQIPQYLSTGPSRQLIRDADIY